MDVRKSVAKTCSVGSNHDPEKPYKNKFRRSSYFIDIK